jgi:hypothetical protein
MGGCGIYGLGVRGRLSVRREGVRRGCMLVIAVGDMLRFQNQLAIAGRGKRHT